MRQVRQLGPVGLLGLLGRLGLVGRVETASPDGLPKCYGFRPSRHNCHNCLSIAGQARPAVLGEVPCV